VPLVALFPLVAVVLSAVLYAFISPEHAEERIHSFIGSWWAFAPLVAAVLLLFPIDRFMDERFRKLRAARKAENAV
jgi:hypothetical protein